jgi:phosphopantothenate-cysteine ligase
MANPTNCTANKFFQANPPPSNLSLIQSELSSYCSLIPSSHHKIVLITSGGTMVPLELNTVRFIDNFSSGLRGAASAEYFLAAGYYVIFLYRNNSQLPFLRHFHKYCYGLEQLNNSTIDNNSITFHTTNLPSYCNDILNQYKEVVREKRLLLIPFISVIEYFYYLSSCSEKLESFGSNAIFYSAAAVSDYYIPSNQQNQHKIASNQSSLQINLSPTPKLLPVLKNSNLSAAYCISFKLETDKEILITKALAAINHYNMQLVVANELHTRYEQVILIAKDEQITINKPMQDNNNNNQPAEIESVLIPSIIEHHNRFMEKAKK